MSMLEAVDTDVPATTSTGTAAVDTPLDRDPRLPMLERMPLAVLLPTSDGSIRCRNAAACLALASGVQVLRTDGARLRPLDPRTV